jgi:hypothetical protein
LAATALIALAVAGCDPFTTEQHAAMNACSAQRTAVAKVECKLAIADPVLRRRAGGNVDLLNLAEAKIRVVAEQVDAGKISKSEGELAVAQTISGITSAERERANSDAFVWAATKPSYCTGTIWKSYASATINSSCY